MDSCLFQQTNHEQMPNAWLPNRQFYFEIKYFIVSLKLFVDNKKTQK